MAPYTTPTLRLPPLKRIALLLPYPTFARLGGHYGRLGSLRNPAAAGDPSSPSAWRVAWVGASTAAADAVPAAFGL